MKESVIDLGGKIEGEIASMFRRTAEKNGKSAEAVLSAFMKDYIVSGGHPEQVNGGQPWNRPESGLNDGRGTRTDREKGDDI